MSGSIDDVDFYLTDDQLTTARLGAGDMDTCRK